MRYRNIHCEQMRLKHIIQQQIIVIISIVMSATELAQQNTHYKNYFTLYILYTYQLLIKLYPTTVVIKF